MEGQLFPREDVAIAESCCDTLNISRCLCNGSSFLWTLSVLNVELPCLCVSCFIMISNSRYWSAHKGMSVGTASPKTACLALDKQFQEGEIAGETCSPLHLQQFSYSQAFHPARIQVYNQNFPLADPFISQERERLPSLCMLINLVQSVEVRL